MLLSFQPVKKTKKAVVTKKEDPVKLQEKQKHKEIFYWQRDIIMRADREKYEKELAKKTAATMKELIQKELAKII